MGIIQIQAVGSFKNRSVKFPAAYGGHAFAVATAIQWLAEEALPDAIQQDHKLQAEGHYPTNRFGLEAPKEEG